MCWEVQLFPSATVISIYQCTKLDVLRRSNSSDPTHFVHTHLSVTTLFRINPLPCVNLWATTLSQSQSTAHWNCLLKIKFQTNRNKLSWIDLASAAECFNSLYSNVEMLRTHCTSLFPSQVWMSSFKVLTKKTTKKTKTFVLCMPELIGLGESPTVCILEQRGIFLMKHHTWYSSVVQINI